MNKSDTCELLLTADLVLGTSKDWMAVNNGAVAVVAGKVAAIGPETEVRARFIPEREIRLGPALIMPGLINSHTHIPMVLLRGLADDLPLMEWLTAHIFPLEKQLTPYMLRIGALLACAEMISSGTTAFFDTYLNEREVYRAVMESGLKARVGEGIFSFPSIGYADPELAFSLIEEQAEELSGHPRVKLAIAPHSVYTTTPDTLKKCVALAQKLALPLHIHLAESAVETAKCIELHGCRPMELCWRKGILGKNNSIAHGVDLTPEEIILLAESGTSVVHNPKSNMKLASGVAPIPQLMEAGVNIALGTDGAASNNTLNLFSEMSACALLHKLHNEDPTVLPAGTVLKMATQNATQVFDWPGLGRLEPGSAADMIALSLKEPNLVPLHNPVSHLVYAANGAEVLLSMVDGEVLYYEGVFNRLDYPGLLQEAAEIGQWMRNQAGL